MSTPAEQLLQKMGEDKSHIIRFIDRFTQL